MGVVTSTPAPALSVAEAKARFSELIERVGQGERFVVSRRGKPALALVPPEEGHRPSVAPGGLLTIVGALADWEDLDETIDEIYASRTRSRDRSAPDLG
jgi:prevent-host-death family protein